MSRRLLAPPHPLTLGTWVPILPLLLVPLRLSLTLSFRVFLFPLVLFPPPPLLPLLLAPRVPRSLNLSSLSSPFQGQTNSFLCSQFIFFGFGNSLRCHFCRACFSFFGLMIISILLHFFFKNVCTTMCSGLFLFILPMCVN